MPESRSYPGRELWHLSNVDGWSELKICPVPWPWLSQSRDGGKQPGNRVHLRARPVSFLFNRNRAQETGSVGSLSVCLDSWHSNVLVLVGQRHVDRLNVVWGWCGWFPAKALKTNDSRFRSIEQRLEAGKGPLTRAWGSSPHGGIGDGLIRLGLNSGARSYGTGFDGALGWGVRF